MRIARILAAFATLIVLPGLHAQTVAATSLDTAVPLGVWRGTIGAHAVMLCFQRDDFDNGPRYYYLNRRRSWNIALTPGDKAGLLWKEVYADLSNAPGATWKLQAAVGAHLDGEWISVDKKQTLPIRLSRVPVKVGTDGTCDNDVDDQDNPAERAFNAPRVVIKVGRWGRHYRSISALGQNLSAIELPPQLPHAATFNRAMRHWLADQVGAYYDCAWSASAYKSYSNDFHQRREIAWQTGTWLVIKGSSDFYCGGAYPDQETDYQTWNLASGKPVEPWRWIGHRKADCFASGCLYTPDTTLNDLIVTYARRHWGIGDCADGLMQNIPSYQLHPVDRGLVFKPILGHAGHLCEVNILVPYAKLRPFLTRRGKLVMKSIKASRESTQQLSARAIR